VVAQKGDAFDAVTVSEFMSADDCESRSTVKPSLSDSETVHEQVTRLPDSYGKYSARPPLDPLERQDRSQVSAVPPVHNLELKILRPLFFHGAPYLKSFTATILKISRFVLAA